LYAKAHVFCLQIIFSFPAEKGKEGLLEGKIEIKREAKLSSQSKLSLFRKKKIDDR